MTPEVEKLREQVVGDIRRAFATVSREDGVTMREAAVIDSYGNREERIAARDLDKDSR